MDFLYCEIREQENITERIVSDVRINTACITEIFSRTLEDHETYGVFVRAEKRLYRVIHFVEKEDAEHFSKVLCNSIKNERCCDLDRGKFIEGYFNSIYGLLPACKSFSEDFVNSYKQFETDLKNFQQCIGDIHSFDSKEMEWIILGILPDVKESVSRYIISNNNGNKEEAIRKIKNASSEIETFMANSGGVY